MLRALCVALCVLCAPVPPALSQITNPKFSSGDEMVQLDFRDVELTVVIETIARITGRNFIYDDRVRGRVTIVSPSEVSVDQAFAVFESVLKVKGFTAVEGPGGVLKIVPVRDAKESAIKTIKDDRPSANRDQFVTRLVPLQYIDADAITNTVKPLVSKEASMVAYAPTNTIIITDTEANIRRLLNILEAIDVETYKEELAVIKVEHADAATLGQQLSEIYGANVTSTSGTTTASSRRRTTSRSRRNQASTGSSATGSLFGKSGASRAKVRIITDDRTNSLLVLASRQHLADIRRLVQQLDIPLSGSGRIHVHFLEHADAEEMAETLQNMLSGQRSAQTAGRTGQASAPPQDLRSQVTALSQNINLTADAATNSLVIQSSKESYDALRRVIEQLDIPRPQVLVEALIMEVDITNSENFGVELFYQTINSDLSFATSTGSTIAEAVTTGTTAGSLANIVKSGIARDPTTGKPETDAEGTDFAVFIQAAAQDGNLNVVASPHILTSDNEEAEIVIGNNIPIITSRVDSATGNTAGLSTSVNVERQDIGVTLRVTPQISEGDQVRLKILNEITDINSTIQEGVGNPNEVGVSLFNRKIENTVVVNNGDTVVVGGLIQDRWAEDVTKVPWLGDIPFLGLAFKQTEKNLRKINLLVFLTPHIVRTDDSMEIESIRKRDEFQRYSGEKYLTDAENLRAIDDASDEKDVWSPNRSPVLQELRDLSSKYSMTRRDQLLEIQRQAEAERREARLATERGAGLRYGLRVAVFQDEFEATETLTKVLDRGYDGTIVTSETGGELLYELLVGPYETMDEAQDVAEVLREVYGLEPVVTVVEIQSDGSSTQDVEIDGSAGGDPDEEAMGISDRLPELGDELEEAGDRELQEP